MNEKELLKGNIAIAKILTSDEFIEEVENPESDVHFLCENTDAIKLMEE